MQSRTPIETAPYDPAPTRETSGRAARQRRDSWALFSSAKSIRLAAPRSADSTKRRARRRAHENLLCDSLTCLGVLQLECHARARRELPMTSRRARAKCNFSHLESAILRGGRALRAWRAPEKACRPTRAGIAFSSSPWPLSPQPRESGRRNHRRAAGQGYRGSGSFRTRPFDLPSGTWPECRAAPGRVRR